VGTGLAVHAAPVDKEEFSQHALPLPWTTRGDNIKEARKSWTTLITHAVAQFILSDRHFVTQGALFCTNLQCGYPVLPDLMYTRMLKKLLLVMPIQEHLKISRCSWPIQCLSNK
jgi:hypothetical protein